MKSKKIEALDDMVAKLLVDDATIQTDMTPPIAAAEAGADPASSEPPSISNRPPVQDDATTGSGHARSLLAGLNLDTAIRLRWALRDIKANRTAWSPVSPDDLAALVELGLVEMRDKIPALTREGRSAIE
jgi:hypothetical protein